MAKGAPATDARPWSRTNLLIKRAIESLGGSVKPVSCRHSDFFLQLQHGERRVVVSKTRSPFLTQVTQTLTNNKFVSREWMRAAGLPAIAGVLVDDGDDPLGESVAEFRSRYEAVVVKPNWGNRGVGVVGPLQTDKEFVHACLWARGLDRDEEVVVEPHIAGTDLRISVIGGKPVAAVEIVRPVLEASQQTVRASIEQLNADARRSTWDRPRLTSLDRIEPEEHLADLLKIFELELDRPLPQGRSLCLPGEEVEVLDRTDDIHPSWMAVAHDACACLGVDVGGVDFRGPRGGFLRAAAMDGPGWLLEVNVLPGLHLHALPTEGVSRPVFEAFVAYCLSLPGAPPPCATTPEGPPAGIAMF